MARSRAILYVVLAIAASCRGDADAERAASCLRLGSGGKLQRSDLAVHLRSSIDRAGRVSPGPVPTCGEDARAAAIFLAAHAALASAPAQLRPSVVTIHVEPRLPADARPLQGIEMHQPSGTILIAGSVRDPARAVWLHEYAHLMMRGDRPLGRVASKLLGAVEEGIADYYAATVQSSPRLGGAGQDGSRDLRNPPRGIASGWEALVLYELEFDEHRHGWHLAAELWRQQPGGGALVEDLLQCMAGARVVAQDSPRAAMKQWLAGCPARSRSAIDAAMRAWLPRELHPRR